MIKFFTRTNTLTPWTFSMLSSSFNFQATRGIFWEILQRVTDFRWSRYPHQLIPLLTMISRAQSFQWSENCCQTNLKKFSSMLLCSFDFRATRDIWEILQHINSWLPMTKCFSPVDSIVENDLCSIITVKWKLLPTNQLLTLWKDSPAFCWVPLLKQQQLIRL